MRKTLKELQSIEKLNYQWTNNMNGSVQRLAEHISAEKTRIVKEEKPTEQPE
jgi:hypothetical protein